MMPPFQGSGACCGSLPGLTPFAGICRPVGVGFGFFRSCGCSKVADGRSPERRPSLRGRWLVRWIAGCWDVLSQGGASGSSRSSGYPNGCRRGTNQHLPTGLIRSGCRPYRALTSSARIPGLTPFAEICRPFWGWVGVLAGRVILRVFGLKHGTPLGLDAGCWMLRG